MKPLILTLIMLLSVANFAHADKEKSITFAELPKTGQELITKHFSNEKIAIVKNDYDVVDWFSSSYKVIFTNGNYVEFDKKGEWEEINCKYTQLPTGILPAAITNLIAEDYSAHKIIEAEREHKRIDVKLSNGLELSFNKENKLVNIDN